MTQAELTRSRSTTAALAIRIIKVRQSTMAALPSCQATTAIRAKDPTMTPSNVADAQTERRSLGSSLPLRATSANPGKKMPIVASNAPEIPATK